MGAQIKDADLLKLSGLRLTSPNQAEVSYRLEELIGEGAHGVVFLALQKLPQAMAPVVVKLLRPRAVRELAGLAGTAINKEVAALRRLSERVPPTPFVVQFLDAGTLRLNDNPLELPWLAVEYVHGGFEGTTLRARVEASLARTGFAFDLARARSATKCMTAGVSAIHEVGVLHRDVTPGNVLCCGFGETEVFKIADFGLARVSSASTFGSVLLGTPAYCAPEQSFPDKIGVGTYSDVFSLACTVFFLLTGEHYFTAPSIPETLVAVQSPERRSLADARRACAELRERRALCLELDRVLARATRADPSERPQTAAELAAALLPLLSLGTAPSLGSAPPARRDERAAPKAARPRLGDFRWTICHAPGGLTGLRSVGWDSNGHFLGATDEGLVYWDGSSFRRVPFDWPWLPRVVQRTGPGRWLLAGDRGVLADFADAKVERWVSAGPNIELVVAAGRLDDIVVAAARRPDQTHEAWAWINGRFLEPLELPDYRAIHACVALDDSRWLMVGESPDGAGLVTEFRPLGHRAKVVACLPQRAALSASSQLAHGDAVLGGRAGYVGAFNQAGLVEQRLPCDGDVSAVGIDAAGRKWAATPGILWTLEESWAAAWTEPTWTTPFTSIMADVGRVIAVTETGGVVQAEIAILVRQSGLSEPEVPRSPTFEHHRHDTATRSGESGRVPAHSREHAWPSTSRTRNAPPRGSEPRRQHRAR